MILCVQAVQIFCGLNLDLSYFTCYAYLQPLCQAWLWPSHLHKPAVWGSLWRCHLRRPPASLRMPLRLHNWTQQAWVTLVRTKQGDSFRCVWNWNLHHWIYLKQTQSRWTGIIWRKGSNTYVAYPNTIFAVTLISPGCTMISSLGFL